MPDDVRKDGPQGKAGNPRGRGGRPLLTFRRFRAMLRP